MYVPPTLVELSQPLVQFSTARLPGLRRAGQLDLDGRQPVEDLAEDGLDPVDLALQVLALERHLAGEPLLVGGEVLLAHGELGLTPGVLNIVVLLRLEQADLVLGLADLPVVVLGEPGLLELEGL